MAQTDLPRSSGKAASRKSRSSQWARTRAFRLREGEKSAWANESSNRRLKNSARELIPPEASFLCVGYGPTAMASTSILNQPNYNDCDI
jgi:hypothetical protein